MNRSTTVLEAQADWLTVTARGQRLTASLGDRVRVLMRGEKILGNRELPFRLGLYQGQRCGRVRWGESATGCLVQLSGDVADEQLDWLVVRVDGITRLDLAVTVQTSVYTPDVANLAYTEAVASRTEHPRAAIPSLVVNGDGGATCYLGKRTGDRYFRCYNKEAECRAAGDEDATTRYARCWRYELELHDEAASAVAHALPPRGARSGWVTNHLYSYLVDHGIVPLFQSGEIATHVGGFRRRSDRESRLDWLSRTVAPTVRWLIDTTPRDDLLTILGLADTEKGTNEHTDA